MIHLISAFRNAVGRLDPWFAQVATLRTMIPVKVMAVTGDSQDATEAHLRLWARETNSSWFRYEHGRPEYGSTEEPDRLTALSGLLNAALEELRRYVQDDDTVIWVEGDLYWDGWTMRLLERFLQQPGVDVVAPMVFAGDAFYDTWAFRTLDGRRWGPFWPYGLLEDFTTPAPLVEMGSVGSCVAMTGHVAKTIRVENNQALVGWCDVARAVGRRIYCAKELRVQHPCDLGATR